MGLTSPCACFETNTWACQTLLLSFFTSNSHIYRGFPASACTYVQQLRAHSRLDACRHMYGNFLPSDSAYSSAVCRAIMAAIMRLSNIAMAYVHINWREWRRLVHHVAPCCSPPPKMLENRARERRNGPAARPLGMWNIQISPHTVTQQQKRGGGGGERGL